ncbi:hypothetical protein [Ornithinibacillus caprae]|uniref:hypothetical protein n=1 Tax=Ornithinibacillus caprae TaxID=2678566 RepID=UPI0018C6D849|nr:hypothetical protein [Ornithinibacillus caprae]
MKFVKGLYVSLVLMNFAVLINTTIFDDAYSGIVMFLCAALFLIGTVFYINAVKLDKER